MKGGVVGCHLKGSFDVGRACTPSLNVSNQRLQEAGVQHRSQGNFNCSEIVREFQCPSSLGLKERNFSQVRMGEA